MSDIQQQKTPFYDATIMMIDDEPLVMEVLQTCLEEHGYRFFVKIEDSTQAVDAIISERPDVVLLDLNMPNMDGFAILQELRNNRDTKYLSVIVLTSSNDSSTKLKALELGATDFLAKPVDRSELVLRIKNSLTVKAYQDQLAYYDTLTQLPNRKLFLDRLDWAIKCAIRESSQVAVLNIAIDRFQQVNELLGTQAGDELLVEVSRRLLKGLRESDTVSRGGPEAAWRNIARLSGDEFSILLTDLKNSSQIVAIAERLRSVLQEPFHLRQREIYITASIGIALFPKDADTTDTLMKHAGAATAYAKEKGRDCYQFFSAEINAAAQQRMNVEHSLRRVLERNELTLYYQPKICAATGAIKGAEALLRWRHPQRGFIPPNEFIPVAEDSGMITQIGEWVLRSACEQNVQWQQNGLASLSMSVNVSAQQFRDNKFPSIVQKILSDTGMDPELLVLEITEGVLMGDRDRVGDLLFKIKSIGALLSIDDFGTGYSSLSYLKTFPIDELKIDRSFIVDTPADGDSAAIVRTIVAMARSLDLQVVAEGVEDDAQFQFLRELSCDQIQGYYFAKPMPAQEFEAFCRQRAPAAQDIAKGA
ncbi:MAG: EAL domain-containing protein [Cellvibrionaceae bacterium]|nr:EAL domain-containing protein [Cellvibrionaceae bacterium]